jgi:hypothetical protein
MSCPIASEHLCETPQQRYMINNYHIYTFYNTNQNERCQYILALQIASSNMRACQISRLSTRALSSSISFINAFLNKCTSKLS